MDIAISLYIYDSSMSGLDIEAAKDKDVAASPSPSTSNKNSFRRHIHKGAFFKCLGMAGKRFCAVTILIAILAALTIPIQGLVELKKYDYKRMSFEWNTNPRDHLVPFDSNYTDYNVLLDGHAHTTVSDGKLTPGQLVEYSIAQGFNALVVTDHNTVKGGLLAEEYALRKYADSFVVIPGMEYSTCRIHMNFININQTVASGNKAFPSDDDIKLAISAAHQLGGLVIVNHIPWSNHSLSRLHQPRLPNHPSVQELIDWGVDGFEVANQATFDMPTYQRVQRHNSESQNNPLIMITGSDVHSPGFAYAWTVVRAPSFTKESIVDELRSAQTSFLFDPTGNQAAKELPNYSSRYLTLSPLSELAQYFGSFYDVYQGQYSFHGVRCQRDIVEMNSLSIGCFVVYFVTVIILFEILYRLLGYLWQKVLAAWHNYRRSRSMNTLGEN